MLHSNDNLDTVFAELRKLEKVELQADKHPSTTGIEVTVRYQYSPAELIMRARAHGFAPKMIYPVHFHGVPLHIKDINPALHVQLANLLEAEAQSDWRRSCRFARPSYSICESSNGRMGYLVFNFHYVGMPAMPHPGIHGLDTEGFVSGLRDLAARYTMVSLDQIEAAVQGGETLPANACLITFDDGLKCQYEVALPILDELKIPAAAVLAGLSLSEPPRRHRAQAPFRARQPGRRGGDRGDRGGLGARAMQPRHARS